MLQILERLDVKQRNLNPIGQSQWPHAALRLGFYSIVSLAASTAFAQDRVWQTFGGGKAEISSYKLTQSRYGEKRSGHEVMIFVPESMDMRYRVKPDHEKRVPKDQLTHVMKLNRSLYFNTGIYNYSVQTSVFSSLYAKDWYKAEKPLKISLGAIEWCGNFFGQIHTYKDRYKWDMRSYFDSERDKTELVTHNAKQPLIYEDNLLIRIRELVKPWKDVQQKELEVQLVPTIWQQRITHKPLRPVKAWISKLKREQAIQENLLQADSQEIVWRWRTDLGREVTVWLNPTYPHVIERWKSNDGSSATRIATLQLPYWQLNSNKDQALRDKLGLP